jgi:hypothetical protein
MGLPSAFMGFERPGLYTLYHRFTDCRVPPCCVAGGEAWALAHGNFAVPRLRRFHGPISGPSPRGMVVTILDFIGLVVHFCVCGNDSKLIEWGCIVWFIWLCMNCALEF